MSDNSYRYTEIFRSLQGEGTYTGVNTLWIRWFLCNLQCNGFGQKDPTNPETYVLPYKDLDLIDIKKVEDLPVFEYGCDSSYSWSKKYKHLAHNETITQIADKLEATLKSKSNPNGKFCHPHTLQETHMAYTGGEPLMKHNQPGIIELTDEFWRRNNLPKYVTVETNGTQALSDEFLFKISGYYPKSEKDTEWFWSVSPKLFSTSGEKQKKAIKPENLRQYANLSDKGHLKYVVNGSNDSWKEVEEATQKFRDEDIDWPVYIMPVGATKESQEETRVADICNEALERGYNISGRMHTYIYGNAIGT